MAYSMPSSLGIFQGWPDPRLQIVYLELRRQRANAGAKVARQFAWPGIVASS